MLKAYMGFRDNSVSSQQNSGLFSEVFPPAPELLERDLNRPAGYHYFITLL